MGEWQVIPVEEEKWSDESWIDNGTEIDCSCGQKAVQVRDTKTRCPRCGRQYLMVIHLETRRKT